MKAEAKALSKEAKSDLDWPEVEAVEAKVLSKEAKAI